MLLVTVFAAIGRSASIEGFEEQLWTMEKIDDGFWCGGPPGLWCLKISD
jgi:hypothetical protein